MATPDPPDRDGTGGRARVGRAHAAVSHASQQAGSAPARVTSALPVIKGEQPFARTRSLLAALRAATFEWVRRASRILLSLFKIYLSIIIRCE